MNSPLKLSLALILAFWSPSIFADHSVRAEAKLATSHDDPKNSQTEIVKKQMTVLLSGSAKSDVTKVTVKVTFYADDLSQGQNVVEKELKAETTLQGGRAEIRFPDVAFEFTPAHAKSSGAGRRTKAVKVPATGRRYHGWVITVSNGTEELARTSSHPSLLTN